MSAGEEEWHIRKGIDSYIATCGKAPVGWYYGRPSPRSRTLMAKIYEEKGLELLYVSDDYSDDLPHWRPSPVEGKGLLHVPYSCESSFSTFLSPISSSSLQLLPLHRSRCHSENYHFGKYHPSDIAEISESGTFSPLLIPHPPLTISTCFYVTATAAANC